MRFAWFCSLAAVVAVGCGGSVREDGAELECTSDLDCAEGQTCVMEGPGRRGASGGTGGGAGVGASGAGGAGNPNGGTGIPLGGSFGTGGTTSGGCPTSLCPTNPCAAGLVCRSAAVPGCPGYMTCQVGCGDPTAPACGPGTVCRASGLCEPVRCDDADFPGCPTGMTCDPTAEPGVGPPGRYSIYGTDQYPYADDRGAALTAEQIAAIGARCVFLRCDEPGAFACAQGFECDVARTPVTTTGCAGIACGELGRCTTDAFICEPTSMGPRPIGVDAHGCVAKNCEEGTACADRYKCDVTRATSGDGCVPIRCDEPGEACDSYDKKCAPDAEPVTHPSGVVIRPDLYGCVTKRCDIDLYPCPSGMACDPASAVSDVYGCVPWTDPGFGGTGGTAGTGGTSVDAGAPGVCR